MTVVPIGRASVHFAVLRPVLKKPVGGEVLMSGYRRRQGSRGQEHTDPEEDGEDGKDDAGNHRHSAVGIVERAVAGRGASGGA